MKQVSTVLTIAGSDPSGGAGIQADIKTISAHELFATSVITSITAQNSKGVQATFDLSPEEVEAQLKAVLEDAKPAAVKTGMLGNEVLVECIARRLKRARIRNLVVDPIIQSSSRKTLLSKKGVTALKEKLLPLALLVTPNLPEAKALSGVRITRPQDQLKAAKAICKLGVRNVLIKGGHAWVYRQYVTDPSLFALEEQAKANGRGLWGLPEAQVQPWEWRRGRRQPVGKVVTTHGNVTRCGT
ncbi:MAG: bifunctional hydroxymethylpyrimidine kinase/phosphomethylpyrimidine kinase, partial [Nitrospinae bacterium]|nr:bifunctional hydroxymethylpyrimidine kinase/phosphomethylpyrimidine kinase [Nitrospinota bacterium]